MRRFGILLAALLWAVPSLPADDEKASLAFETHVRPLLKTHCFHCHGEETEKEGNLDVRLMRLGAKGGDSGPAIVPGKASESLLVQRIEAGNREVIADVVQSHQDHNDAA